METEKINSNNAKCFAKDCNHTTSLKLCSGCKFAFYCSEECQRNEWKTHQNVCSVKAFKDTLSKTLSSLKIRSDEQEMLVQGWADLVLYANDLWKIVKSTPSMMVDAAQQAMDFIVNISQQYNAFVSSALPMIKTIFAFSPTNIAWILNMTRQGDGDILNTINERINDIIGDDNQHLLFVLSGGTSSSAITSAVTDFGEEDLLNLYTNVLDVCSLISKAIPDWVSKDTFIGYLERAKATITELWKVTKSAITTAWDITVRSTKTVVTWVRNFLKFIMHGMRNAFYSISETVSHGVKVLCSGIVMAAEEIDIISTSIGDRYNKFRFLTDVAAPILEIICGAGYAVTSIPRLVDTIDVKATQLMAELNTWITSRFGKWTHGIASLASEKIQQLFQSIREWSPSIYAHITNGIATAFSLVKSEIRYNLSAESGVPPFDGSLSWLLKALDYWMNNPVKFIMRGIVYIITELPGLLIRVVYNVFSKIREWIFGKTKKTQVEECALALVERLREDGYDDAANEIEIIRDMNIADIENIAERAKQQTDFHTLSEFWEHISSASGGVVNSVLSTIGKKLNVDPATISVIDERSYQQSAFAYPRCLLAASVTSGDRNDEFGKESSILMLMNLAIMRFVPPNARLRYTITGVMMNEIAKVGVEIIPSQRGETVRLSHDDIDVGEIVRLMSLKAQRTAFKKRYNSMGTNSIYDKIHAAIAEAYVFLTTKVNQFDESFAGWMKTYLELHGFILHQKKNTGIKISDMSESDKQKFEWIMRNEREILINMMESIHEEVRNMVPERKLLPSEFNKSRVKMHLANAETSKKLALSKTDGVEAIKYGTRSQPSTKSDKEKVFKNEIELLHAARITALNIVTMIREADTIMKIVSKKKRKNSSSTIVDPVIGYILMTKALERYRAAILTSLSFGNEYSIQAAMDSERQCEIKINEYITYYPIVKTMTSSPTKQQDLSEYVEKEKKIQESVVFQTQQHQSTISDDEKRRNAVHILEAINFINTDIVKKSHTKLTVTTMVCISVMCALIASAYLVGKYVVKAPISYTNMLKEDKKKELFEVSKGVEIINATGITLNQTMYATLKNELNMAHKKTPQEFLVNTSSILGDQTASLGDNLWKNPKLNVTHIITGLETMGVNVTTTTTTTTAIVKGDSGSSNNAKKYLATLTGIFRERQCALSQLFVAGRGKGISSVIKYYNKVTRPVVDAIKKYETETDLVKFARHYGKEYAEREVEITKLNMIHTNIIFQQARLDQATSQYMELYNLTRKPEAHVRTLREVLDHATRWVQNTGSLEYKSGVEVVEANKELEKLQNKQRESVEKLQMHREGIRAGASSHPDLERLYAQLDIIENSAEAPRVVGLVGSPTSMVAVYPNVVADNAAAGGAEYVRGSPDHNDVDKVYFVPSFTSVTESGKLVYNSDINEVDPDEQNGVYEDSGGVTLRETIPTTTTLGKKRKGSDITSTAGFKDEKYGDLIEKRYFERSATWFWKHNKKVAEDIYGSVSTESIFTWFVASEIVNMSHDVVMSISAIPLWFKVTVAAVEMTELATGLSFPFVSSNTLAKKRIELMVPLANVTNLVTSFFSPKTLGFSKVFLNGLIALILQGKLVTWGVLLTSQGLAFLMEYVFNRETAITRHIL